jgi:polyhydroxybutyrate depolymerase
MRAVMVVLWCCVCACVGGGLGEGDAGEASGEAAAGSGAGTMPGTLAGTPGVSAGTTGAGSVAGAGSSVDADGGGSDAGAPRGTGPGDWVAGDYPDDIHAQTYLEIKGVPGQKGYTRQYKVHVPPSYDPSVPTPLVFCIHGLSQNPVMFCVDGTAMHEKSDAEGFLMVMPAGYQNSWNAGTCCGAASTEQLDDVALFRAIFDEVSAHLNVDLDRVYATGLSNGGYMSHRLACEAADLVAAVAPNAGAVGINSIGGGTNAASDFTECKPSEPVSVLDIHGTADTLVAYSLQKPSLELWATNNTCTKTTAPASAPASGGDTTCVSHSGCPEGIEVTGCTVQNGGHCWFGSADCGTGGGAIGSAVVGANSDTLDNNDAIWEFFERHRK